MKQGVISHVISRPKKVSKPGGGRSAVERWAEASVRVTWDSIPPGCVATGTPFGPPAPSTGRHVPVLEMAAPDVQSDAPSPSLSRLPALQPVFRYSDFPCGLSTGTEEGVTWTNTGHHTKLNFSS